MRNDATKRTSSPSRSSRSSSEPIPLKAVPALVPSHEEIAKRAFEIWCGKGRPQGTAEQDWVEAERSLSSGR